ncbi:MAG: glycerophosphodiester phosphodiesterase family protein [Bergeyella sp.]
MKSLFSLTAVFFMILMNAQTKIIAHRGFWKTNLETTENSIKSLENAQKLKLYGSEFDVHMTKDGKLVVNHDEHHAKINIPQTRYCDLKKVKLSNGETLPTLKQYLKQGKKEASVRLIVELKPAKTKELENEVVAKTLKMIKKMNLENQCDYISFSLNICKEIKRLNPKAHVQYLEGNLSPEQVKAEGLDGLDYHYSVFQKNPEWISQAKALRLTTNAWTVNDPEVFKKLSEAGIDMITTNVPDVFVEIQKK